MTLFDHQGFAVLIEEQPDLRGRGRIVQQERVIHDLIDVEEFNRFQRAPDFLPASREVRAMQDVHQRPFQTCDAYCHTRALGRQDAEVLRAGAEKRFRKLGSPEDLRAEREQPHRAGRGVDQVTLDRVGSAMELECRVMMTAYSPRRTRTTRPALVS